ncbi:hypothetical protein APHAL10511_002095 [Amanita phalloides]|nr:hypothetical protein APHAL10511_002095 [Amanita phalloides]
MFRYYYGPSRAFWFLFGAASASLWIKYRDCRHANSRVFGPCIRQRPLEATPQARNASTDPTASPPTELLQAPDGLRTVSRVINNIPPTENWPYSEGYRKERWEEDKERLIDFTLRATDTIADMSESTLETLLASLENLKTKIAEHRAQREKQRQRLDAQPGLQKGGVDTKF